MVKIIIQWCFSVAVAYFTSIKTVNKWNNSNMHITVLCVRDILNMKINVHCFPVVCRTTNGNSIKIKLKILFIFFFFSLAKIDALSKIHIQEKFNRFVVFMGGFFLLCLKENFFCFHNSKKIPCIRNPNKKTTTREEFKSIFSSYSRELNKTKWNFRLRLHQKMSSWILNTK